MTPEPTHALNAALTRQRPRSEPSQGPSLADRWRAFWLSGEARRCARALAAADPPVAVDAPGADTVYRAGRGQFVARGDGFQTQAQDADTIRGMLAVAQSQGLRTVTATGSRAFKQRAWLLGQVMGVEVQGWRPTERDRALLAKVRVQARGNALASDAKEPPPRTARPEPAATPARAARPKEIKTPPQQRGPSTADLAAQLLVDAPDQAREWVKAGLFLDQAALDARWRDLAQDLPPHARRAAKAFVARLGREPRDRLRAALAPRFDLGALEAEARLERIQDCAARPARATRSGPPVPGFEPLPPPAPRPGPAAQPRPNSPNRSRPR